MEKNETKRTLKISDVCVLVGIITLIASIAHPPITQAMDEKKLSDMVDRLRMVRSQIRLYKVEKGLYPGQQQIGDRSVTADEFVAALKEQQADRSRPYLETFPANPYASDANSANRVICVNDPDAHPSGTEAAGWWYNAATGEFYACDSTFHTNY